MLDSVGFSGIKFGTQYVSLSFVVFCCWFDSTSIKDIVGIILTVTHFSGLLLLHFGQQEVVNSAGSSGVQSLTGGQDTALQIALPFWNLQCS